MHAVSYQFEAERTQIHEPGFDIPGSDMMVIWNAIGLAGEAGEVANTAKKGIFHQHGLDREKLAEELGDCLWYIAAMCSALDISLSDVMTDNIEKLKSRYPNGYNAMDSRSRMR